MLISKLLSSKYILILICILFLSTRLYKIDQIPSSVYWDEASIGYNAYSILETGKDEWGKVFPLAFEAFGEYKLPIYIYIVSIFEKILGLNILAVRLPAVFFSLASIVLIYLVGKKVGEKESVGLWAAFFAVLSPWFFIFSRTGYEVTAGLMFYLLGIYAFFLAFEKKWALVLSTFSFIFSLFSYNGFRIITPITLVILIAFHYRFFFAKYKENMLVLVISLLLLSFTSLLIINSIYSGQATSRLDEVGILNSFVKKQPLIKQLAINYSSHFQPQFLFLQGDQNQRSQQTGLGQLYFMDLFLIILGIFTIFKSRIKNGLLILILLLISPLPASIAKEAPHALRSLSVVPFLSILLAFGTTKLFTFAKVKYFPVILVFIYLILFINYFNKFISEYPKFSGEDWQLGYKTAILDYKEKFEKFDNILISDHYGQPYIFALFYLKYPPHSFLKNADYNTTIRSKTSLVKSFDKFIFTNIDYHSFPPGRSLIFAHPSERMDEINYKQVLRFPDDKIMFYVYEDQR